MGSNQIDAAELYLFATILPLDFSEILNIFRNATSSVATPASKDSNDVGGGGDSDSIFPSKDIPNWFDIIFLRNCLPNFGSQGFVPQSPRGVAVGRHQIPNCSRSNRLLFGTVF